MSLCRVVARSTREAVSSTRRMPWARARARPAVIPSPTPRRPPFDRDNRHCESFLFEIRSAKPSRRKHSMNDLVQRLATGKHRVVYSRADKAQDLKAAIDRGYVLLKFTE